MHANNDPLGVRSAYRSAGRMRWGGLLEFASRQTGFLPLGRITIVASISQKCPEVAAVLWINFPDVANRPQKARGAGLAVDTAALRPASYAWQAALARDQVTQNKSAQAALRLRLKEVLYAQLYC